MSDIEDDKLDAYITAAAAALKLPVDAAWQPSVRTHLKTTLRLAQMVDEFALPDEAEPAPVFEA